MNKKHMNKTSCEQKLSCMLFECPMIEEINSCSISNLRILTSKQKFWVTERMEKQKVYSYVSAKYLCMKSKEM